MIHIYPVPPGEPVFDGYTAEAEGQTVPVLKVRCSAVPFNRRWPGHQRSIDQSELCGMIRFSFQGSVELKITVNRDFGRAEIRPASRGAVLRRDGRVLYVTITEAAGYSLEIDGYHNNLHIFADAPETKPEITDSTIYYGPGYHEAGIVQLVSHSRVYIDEGAVVYGCFHARDAEDIVIQGRGILDNSHNIETILYEVEKLGDGLTEVTNNIREHTVHLINCRNILLDGFTIRDSLVYNVGLWGCEDIEIRDLRIIGCWRYNSDGIDFHNCRNGHVAGCFIRTFDDTVCYKGHLGFPSYCEDCVTENCVVWCDWDHCLEFGAECCAEHMRRLVFRNIDVIRSLDVALNVGNVDFGTISDILYEDIRVTYDPVHQKPAFQADDDSVFPYDPESSYRPLLIALTVTEHHEYSQGRKERGHIKGVTFRNISVSAPFVPPILLAGYDESHRVEDVTIENLTLNGVTVTGPEGLDLTVNPFADPPRFIGTQSGGNA